jgi:hypothetical protein
VVPWLSGVFGGVTDVEKLLDASWLLPPMVERPMTPTMAMAAIADLITPPNTARVLNRRTVDTPYST